jgi:ABC-2 type transport system permease protein
MTPATAQIVASRPRPGLLLTVAAEWAKLSALRSTRLIVLIAAALTVGITLLVSVFGGAGLAQAQTDSRYSVIFFSSFFGTWAMAALGAHVVSIEYASGMIVTTLTATPARWRVLTAKMVIVGIFAVTFGTVVSFVNFFVSQAIVAASGGQSLRITDDGMLRAVGLFIGISALTQSLLAAAVAVFTRSAFGAVVLTLLTGALPVLVAPLLGEWWGNRVPRFVPGAAVESVAGVATPGSAGYLPLPAAVLVLLLWLGVFIVAAFVAFARRDS